MYHVCMSNRYSFSLMILVLVLMFQAGCASDETKVPSPEVVIAQEAFDLAIEIRDVFIDKDSSDLKSLCSEAMYRKLADTMKAFRGLSLDFTKRWVDIDTDGTVHLYIAWQRKGEYEGKDASGAGMAVFVLRGSPFLLEDILRENPFSE